MHEKKHTGNRCLEIISKILNLCEEWEYREDNSNPCRKIKKYIE
ncbi:MAG: hypothetical protein DGJ47_000838 [Rickettsiaceae bacterium]